MKYKAATLYWKKIKIMHIQRDIISKYKMFYVSRFIKLNLRNTRRAFPKTLSFLFPPELVR